MFRSLKVLLGTTCLLALGSCACSYISSQKGTEEFTLWSDTPPEMRVWDWLGIILLFLSGAIGLAAYRVLSGENEDKLHSNELSLQGESSEMVGKSDSDLKTT